MTMSMSVAAFAQNIADHTFTAYQIFSGTQAADKAALCDVEWGSGVDGAAILAELKEADTVYADCETAADVAEVVAGFDSNSAAAMAFARIVDAHRTGTTTALNKGEQGYTISTPGYYLIVDTTKLEDGSYDALNLSLLQCYETITIATKTDIPTVVKKVDDVNDSNTSEDTVVWQDSADYDIGDEIPYQITGTLGDISKFPTYYVNFHDTMTNLTLKTDSVTVTLDNETVNKNNYLVAWDPKTKTLDVEFMDVVALGAKTNSVIVVSYIATLDEGANIGATGNPNEVYLEFSNNPNNSGNGTTKPSTGKTPVDTNIIFTYKVIANKVDPAGKPLAGAKFALYKAIGTDEKGETIWQDLGEVGDGEKDTTFAWTGLDDGDYKIVETKVPEGYNKIADQYFTVTAGHDILSDNPALTELSGNSDTGMITLASDKEAGSLSTNIENKQGTVLPSTGGMGTTVLYTTGAILVIGAGVVLVARRRVAK